MDYSKLHVMTESLLDLMQRFFPNIAPLGSSHLDWIRKEVKGSDLRKDACEGGRNIKRHRKIYISNILGICEAIGAKLTGRIWIKGIGQPINGVSIYTFSIQSIYTDFQNYLTKTNDIGQVIVDSRLQHLNAGVAHSIFTQKFKGTGDSYDRIIELPAFSHSENHAGLQISDTICSAVMTPIAVNTYCAGYINSLHVRPGYGEIKNQFAPRCRALQHRYQEASGRDKGGFMVSDALGQRPGGLLFR